VGPGPKVIPGELDLREKPTQHDCSDNLSEVGPNSLILKDILIPIWQLK